MTPDELAVVVAAPLTANSWRGVNELTPSQLASILAALAGAGQTNHLQTGGSSAVPTYVLGDGGSVTSTTGTDSAGNVQVTTGTGGPGTLLTMAFAANFTSTPEVFIWGADAASAALLPFPQSVGGSGFSLVLGAASAPATNYSFGWLAVGAPN